MLFRSKYPHITLESAIPCETQAIKWSVASRERYYNICLLYTSNLLARNGVRIEGNTVTQNGEPLFKIHRRHATRKTQGCYRELMPTLEYVRQEQKQEKPSIRDQLRTCLLYTSDEGYEEEPYINEDDEPQIAEDAETDGDED